ncbi:hypothetical protein [Streptomyces sp. NPDC092903]
MATPAATNPITWLSGSYTHTLPSAAVAHGRPERSAHRLHARR